MKTVKALLTISAIFLATPAMAERVETDGPNRTIIYKDNGNVTVLDGNTHTVEEYTADEWGRGKKTTISQQGVKTEAYDFDKVVTELGGKQQGGDMVIELPDNILFFSGSYSLTTKSAETLKKLAYIINTSRKGNVYVYGHTDSVGSDADNQKLSENRANAVTYWLNMKGGVDLEYLKPMGMGEQFPVASNNTEAGKQENRRVEVVIQTDQLRDVQGYYRTPAPLVPSASPAFEPAVVSSCSFPMGKYKYLFSDGYQTYYFSKDHTIYVNPDGTQIVKKGDFKLKASVSTYERLGGKFIYTNPAGTYTSVNGGEIIYKPSAVAAPLVAATQTYSDEFGSYKRKGSKIVFTPKRQLPDLNVTESNCQLVNVN